MNSIDLTLKQLLSAFPNTPVKEETIVTYLRLLQDIPCADFQTVVDQCIAECRFFPTIAEIRDRWHAMTRTLADPTNAEAWGLVQKAVREVGYIGSPRFRNERVAKVVGLIGWRELCACEEPDVMRAQFMRMYDAVANREEQIAKLLPQSRRLVETRGLLPVGDTAKRLLGGM